MNKIAVHLDSDLDFLKDFVASAIAFGQSKMAEVDPATGLEIHVGGKSFRFVESEPFLLPNLGLCLKTNPVIDGEAPDYSVFADYSSWHLDNGFGPPHEKFKSMAALNDALKRIGVHGCYMSHEQRWDLFDPKLKFGVRLQDGVEKSPIWETTSPLTHFCSWMAQEDDKIMLHAASVAYNGVGALLVGAGGAGKSGTTLGAMLGELQSSGDDYTLLTLKAPYFAHAVHRSVKQDIVGLQRLGLVSDFEVNWQNKAVFRPEDVIGTPIADAVEVRAIIMPRRGADKTALREISSSEVFKALSFSTMSQLGADPATFFKSCGDLIRSLPCYGLDMSDDNDAVVDALKSLLSLL